MDEDKLSELGMELIEAKKEIHEWESKYNELNERFSQVLADRDKLIKENAELQNELHKTRPQVGELFMYKRLLYLKLKEEVGDEMSDMR